MPRLWRRGAGQSAARVPIRAAKTRKPPAASGHGSRLPLELAGLDLREDAVCRWRCNKRGCQDYFRGEKKRKLTDAMIQGNTNDPCLPKQYKVKKIKEIWGVSFVVVERHNLGEEGLAHERVFAQPKRDQSQVEHEAEGSLPALAYRARGRGQAAKPARLARRKQATELPPRFEDGSVKLHRALGEAAQLLDGLR